MSDLFVSLQKAVTYVCYGLVIVLAIVSVVVISNTIKITVFNRRKEIGIMKLVGATNGFIRFPFFVECYLRPDLRADRFRHCVRRILCRV